MGSPLYGALLERCAGDARQDGIVAGILGADAGNAVESALALRFMAAVHRVALSGDAPALAAHYPSCGGDGNADAAWQAFLDVLHARAEQLQASIKEPLQTNEVNRAAALLGGFLLVQAQTRLPLRLLEIGASAGLNLRWDHFRYLADRWSWGPTDSPVRLSGNFKHGLPFPDERAVVAARLGCDQAPIDPTTDDGRLRLLSFVWADQLKRIAQLEAACKVARRVPAHVERADAVPWLESMLNLPQESVATVVFHTIVMQYLTPTQRERLAALIEQAGTRATSDAPLAHLSLEPRSGANVVLKLWPGGKETGLAQATLHGLEIDWLFSPSVRIRPLEPADSITALTELLHRSYKPLADLGLNFTATYQDDATTLARIERGQCFVAERNQEIIGTFTVYRPAADHQSNWYRRGDVACLGQLAVDPAYQRLGIGSDLLRRAEEAARRIGAAELALDTAKPAKSLIRYYASRGYRVVEEAQWPGKTYVSVIFSKRLQRRRAHLTPQSDILSRFVKNGRLSTLPVSLDKRLVVLRWVAEQFDDSERFPERSVNATLARVHPDYALLRRALIDHGFMARADGLYWRIKGPPEE